MTKNTNIQNGVKNYKCRLKKNNSFNKKTSNYLEQSDTSNIIIKNNTNENSKKILSHKHIPNQKKPQVIIKNTFFPIQNNDTKEKIICQNFKNNKNSLSSQRYAEAKIHSSFYSYRMNKEKNNLNEAQNKKNTFNDVQLLSKIYKKEEISEINKIVNKNRNNQKNNNGNQNSVIKINNKLICNNKLDIGLNKLNSSENKNITTSLKNLYYTNSDSGLFKNYFYNHKKHRSFNDKINFTDNNFNNKNKNNINKVTDISTKLKDCLNFSHHITNYNDFRINIPSNPKLNNQIETCISGSKHQKIPSLLNINLNTSITSYNPSSKNLQKIFNNSYSFNKSIKNIEKNSKKFSIINTNFYYDTNEIKYNSPKNFVSRNSLYKKIYSNSNKENENINNLHEQIEKLSEENRVLKIEKNAPDILLISKYNKQLEMAKKLQSNIKKNNIQIKDHKTLIEKYDILYKELKEMKIFKEKYIVLFENNNKLQQKYKYMKNNYEPLKKKYDVIRDKLKILNKDNEEKNILINKLNNQLENMLNEKNAEINKLENKISNIQKENEELLEYKNKFNEIQLLNIALQKNLDMNDNIQKKYNTLIKDYKILKNNKKYCDEMVPKINEINFTNKELVNENNRLIEQNKELKDIKIKYDKMIIEFSDLKEIRVKYGNLLREQQNWIRMENKYNDLIQEISEVNEMKINYEKLQTQVNELIKENEIYKAKENFLK